MKESASAEETPIGGASQEPLLPGTLREPGLREAAVRVTLDADYRSGEHELHCIFSSDLKKEIYVYMPIEERDVQNIIVEMEAII